MGLNPRYEQVIENLVSRGVMPTKAPAIEPTERVLKAMGYFDWPFWQSYLQDPRKVIIVAGTNGKGSVCATLEALFLKAGEKVGLYTSPHLIEHTERIRYCGKDLDQDLFVEAFDFVNQIAGVSLSHFEMLTLMAVRALCSGQSQPPVDRLILEVGLGGTWDATNAIPHGLAVITKLGIDHENILGPGLWNIAQNKLGVLRPEMTLIHAPFPPEISSNAQEFHKIQKGRWIQAPVIANEVQSFEKEFPRFLIQFRGKKQEINLPGRRGVENTAIALTAFEESGYDPVQYLDALSQVNWPGRMERFYSARHKRDLFLSGDHNQQGIESLLELLPYYPRSHLHILVGVGKDKDIAGILNPLSELPDCSLYFTETPFKGLKVTDYGQWLSFAKGSWSHPLQAVDEVCARAKSNELIVITGSLYLVGLIRGKLRPSD